LAAKSVLPRTGKNSLMPSILLRLSTVAIGSDERTGLHLHHVDIMMARIKAVREAHGA
jgi:hypothetical protein